MAAFEGDIYLKWRGKIFCLSDYMYMCCFAATFWKQSFKIYKSFYHFSRLFYTERAAFDAQIVG